MRLVVVGQGYVGLPLAQEAVKAGLQVIGFEQNTARVADLNNGRSHVDDISDAEVRTMAEAGYRASADPADLGGADAIVICVPTPLTIDGAPDLSAVRGAVGSIAENLTDGTLVVLESTTYPGTTEEVVLPILEAGGLRLDQHFYLAFSPERIDPGNPHYGLANTPKVVGGVSDRSTDVAVAFYSRFVDTVVRAKGAKEAETAKLLENTYRHINIALVNEMAKFCHDLGIDIWDVIDAASSKPFGFQAFRPGPGVGGHCIPIDPNYLSFEVKRRLGYPFRFVELAESINASMPSYVVDRVGEILAGHETTLEGASILLLGVTYKANIADQRESPAVDVAEELLRRGASVNFHDPHVERWFLDSGERTRVESLDESIVGADVVVLLQAHDEYEVDALAARSRNFFDTRGVTRAPGAVRL
ncbi:nucleotide sugar dehydrogenase [Curtobacterium sp. PhB142]|uniref:nucleotide sugar dehydrogenase n=1 Tax=unclassified Curtobacterium TaxID=257496 RepID=UPI001048B710|nr:MULTISPECIES: nucleotide sugar dehydrogenase [unclassified Curtobacterium]TCL85172.1 nucleotide sugar dehydrogenase [Curtobacterium sp. PhB142]TCM01897.1 nucleotide sugar dehydrogenase [Curtobacterium sp. PhB134]